MKFSLADGRSQLYQWDSDVILVFPDLEDGTEIHFGVSAFASLKVHVEDGKVTIPNVLLQRNKNILLYVFQDDATTDSGEIEVVGRPKPPEYIYTEPEKLVWETVNEKMNEVMAAWMQGVYYKISAQNIAESDEVMMVQYTPTQPDLMPAAESDMIALPRGPAGSPGKDGDDRVFIAEYEKTTLAEIVAAHNGGMVCVCRKANGMVAPARIITESVALFSAFAGANGGNAYGYTVTSENKWSATTEHYEKTYSITAERTDDQIPTAKAVWNAIQEIEFPTEVFTGTPDTPFLDWQAAAAEGKLCVLKRPRAGGSVKYIASQIDGGIAYFYMVNYGKVETAKLDATTGEWAYETKALDESNTFVGNDDTTYAEFAEAYNSGKMCFWATNYGGSGRVMWTVRTVGSGKAYMYAVDRYGQIVSCVLNEDGTYKTTSYVHETTISEKSTDNQIPTAKAVYDFVQENGGGLTDDDKTDMVEQVLSMVAYVQPDTPPDDAPENSLWVDTDDEIDSFMRETWAITYADGTEEDKEVALL